VRAEADLTRRRGYAVERDELRPGVSGVAAPVFGAGGDPLAAIGVSTDEPIEPGRLADAVVPIAQDLTEVLGG
jgi:DNA-binding IclR family transcriptional regulator